MKHETIHLYSNNDHVTLTTYLLDDKKEYSKHLHPAMVVFPGGGYGFLSDREAEPIALAYLAAGFQTFVLNYSIANTSSTPKVYGPLLDGSMAIAYIRDHAEEWCIDPDQIAVVGFSAGGHAACYLGTHWQDDIVSEKLGIAYGKNRPNAMVLCYPVITSGEKAHRGSFNNLLEDKKDDPAMLLYTSLEKQVSENTPPAYLWHTASDQAVPVENSLLFAAALSEKKIPYELHIYPEGVHGLSLVNDLVTTEEKCPCMDYVARWFDESVKWLKKTFNIKH